MKKVTTITMLAFLLGMAGCNQVLDTEIGYTPPGAIVEATIRMPDGKLEKVKVKRWRQWKGTDAIAIETEDSKEYLTSVNNVVMICEHPEQKESK